MTSELLRPLKTEPQEPRNILSFDLESKKHDSQKAGFERPFLVGAYDARGKKYTAFFDDRDLDQKDRDRAFGPGGCIDKFFRWLTETSAGRKFQSATKNGEVGTILYAHNGGAFDTLHLVRWLRRPENAKRFRIRMIASGSQLLELRITPVVPPKFGRRKKGPRKGKSHKLSVKGWVIRDSMRLAAGSLDDAARKLSLSVQKTRMPKELGGLDADERQHDAWRDYNRPDCEVAAGVVLKFQSILQKLGGRLCMTLPASSMDLFRRKYLPAFLKSAHLEGCRGGDACPERGYGGCNFMRDRPGLPRERHFPDCPSICPECRHPERCKRTCSRRRLKRKACPADPYGCLHSWITLAPTGVRHGGRTEVFRHRETKGELKYYDRNSSYAACMLEAMPLRLHSVDSFPDSHPLEGDAYAYCEKRAGQGLVGFIEATVFIPEECNLPPLPIVYNDKLIFPTGWFHGRWDWCELRHIKSVGGRIISIDKAVWYRAAPVLAPMMRALYRMRQTARSKEDFALASVCKDLMNALYGKFIMSPDRRNIVATTEAEAPINAVPIVGEQALHEPLGSTLLYGLPSHVEAPYFLPHIGAHITALGREQLWLKMQEIEKKKGVIHYVDTDAIIFTGPTLPSSDALGAWKRVHSRVKKLAGHFDSPKSYALTSLSGEPLDDVHAADCVQRRKDGDERAYACKGCATSGVHIKGLHRSYHTVDNFEALLAGDTIEVEDQTPKLGELLACDFQEYVTVTRRLSSHAKRPKHERDNSVFVDKRIRIGDDTRPIYITSAVPWVYLDHGKARRSTLREHLEWLDERRTKYLRQLRRRLGPNAVAPRRTKAA